MDPVTSNAVSRSITRQQGPGGAEQKLQPSKFDQVRLQLENRQAVTLPPEVTQLSPQQRQQLAGDLRKRIERARSPKAIFRSDFNQTRECFTDVSRRVDQLPKTSAFEPLRNRLASIESQFNQTGKIIDGLGNITDPKDLLKLQMEMFQITQNLEIVSKVVDQVNSGVKQILQIQV